MQHEHLIAPSELKKKFTIIEDQRDFIASSRAQIRAILNGRDPRILLIVGPCSIHDPKSCLEYAKKLKNLSCDVNTSFFIVMRAYYEKPRSQEGWKGILYDPDLNGSHDIKKGLAVVRTFLLELASLHMPVATEFLDPFSAPYFSDLISWGCIGARTAESQIHRQLASSLKLPIGFKNSTSGNIEVAINGMIAAASPHTYMGLSEEVVVSLIRSSGNPECYLTLRGGDSGPNCDPESIFKSLQMLEKYGLKRRIILDCCHGNSNKDLSLERLAFQSAIHQIAEGNQEIRGLILESELFAGNQPLIKGIKPHYGVSITVPCLGFLETESLIRLNHEKLQKQEALLACRN